MRLKAFYIVFATAFVLSFFIQLLYKATLLPGPYLKYQRTAVITYGNLERGERGARKVHKMRAFYMEQSQGSDGAACIEYPYVNDT